MTIKNLNSFKRNLEKKMTTNARKNVKIAVTRGTSLVEDEAKESIAHVELAKHTKSIIQEERTQHQNQGNHQQLILVF